MFIKKKGVNRKKKKSRTKNKKGVSNRKKIKKIEQKQQQQQKKKEKKTEPVALRLRRCPCLRVGCAGAGCRVACVVLVRGAEFAVVVQVLVRGATSRSRSAVPAPAAHPFCMRKSG